MEPWSIIGWIILALFAVYVLVFLLGFLSGTKDRIKNYWRHLSTRSIQPQEGQLWRQGKDILEIGKRHEAGHFTIRSGDFGSSISWGETDEQWRSRVKRRKLYLIQSK